MQAAERAARMMALRLKVLRIFKDFSLREAEEASTFASMNETFVIFAMSNPINNKPRFRLIVLTEAMDFVKSLAPSVQRKIVYNIDKVQAGFTDAELFKKLEGTEIWEFRTLYKGKAYRLFAFWDTQTDTLVVVTHGIVKKRQKTPAKEIAKAERHRQLYFDNKTI